MTPFKPQSPDPFTRKGSDMAPAKFGHLNEIVRHVTALEGLVGTSTEGVVEFSTPNIYAATTGITAGTTQTQAGATALTSEFNNVTTVGTASDGVKLPTATKGLSISVKNAGTNVLKVYPFLGDFIDDELVNVAITVPVETVVTFRAISATTWQSDIENVASTVVTTDTISEKTAGAGVTVDGALIKDGNYIRKSAPTAMNITATASATQILTGYITSTSAAAVGITTPTATALAAVIGAVQGTSFDLTIDNSAGANTVTLILDGSIAVVTPAITGGATLTVSTANAIGIFRFVFTSGTTAKVFRIA